MRYKDMTDEQLIELFIDCWRLVYVDEVFGTRDMLAIEHSGAELERRGYTITDTPTQPTISKGAKA